jgi:hypothetical protein
MEGDLVEGIKLLSLAWLEVGGCTGGLRRNLRNEREDVVVATLLLVRSWVGGDDGGQVGGECGGRRRPRRREKEGR